MPRAEQPPDNGLTCPAGHSIDAVWVGLRRSCHVNPELLALLADEELCAPTVLDFEVGSALRGHILADKLEADWTTRDRALLDQDAQAAHSGMKTLGFAV